MPRIVALLGLLGAITSCPDATTGPADTALQPDLDAGSSQSDGGVTDAGDGVTGTDAAVDVEPADGEPADGGADPGEDATTASDGDVALSDDGGDATHAPDSDASHGEDGLIDGSTADGTSDSIADAPADGGGETSTDAGPPPPECGDGTIDTGETCDPPETCPTTCDDQIACTDDALSGSPGTCDALCAFEPIESCVDGDGCCPAGCVPGTDGDCSTTCGNSALDDGETCDPPESCPTACDDGDACTVDLLVGSAANCNATCAASPLTDCVDDDGCCPLGCNANDDTDCDPVCGNNVEELGETCDPPSSCPVACVDAGSCSPWQLLGDPTNCTSECFYTTITACTGGDACCPAGCDSGVDTDCGAVCGNGEVEVGETCDPPSSCPTLCDDGDSCTADSLAGAAATCTAECLTSPVTACGPGDGCCPSGCAFPADGDCPTICGNGNIDFGETCDPPSSCTTSCVDAGACTPWTLSGSPATCNTQCSYANISECVSGDGCCPGGCDGSTDADCASTCGDTVVGSGETCDPPSSCPTLSDCLDDDPCTINSLAGNAFTCNAQCLVLDITWCEAGDGCCPQGCVESSDADCAVGGPVCGDGMIEVGETCDPPSTCPTGCDDAGPCAPGVLQGAPASCDAQCTWQTITTCVDGDGCCAAGCDLADDSDCLAVCGDGVVDAAETCDPPSSCPTNCNDFDACTTDALGGSLVSCTAACVNQPVTACNPGDGCCPSGCDSTNDADCVPECGNSVVEPGETCDPPGSCPVTCNDSNPCTSEQLVGSSTSCDARCVITPISACGGAEGCCPVGCNATNDPDCAATCGNLAIEAGETCDPQISCPTSCDDPGTCVSVTLTGDASTCNAFCSLASITTCADGDGCCPPSCDSLNDDDCATECGNGLEEAGETCDPEASCPASCDDGNACTTDTLIGSPATCNSSCTSQPILSCISGDGCCPGACHANNDSDCTPSCDNGIVESGETCDPPSSCPVACDDGNSCTVDSLTGSSATCDAACASQPITGCADGDGCCPSGCTSNTDADCAAVCGNSVEEAGETCDPPSSCPSSCDDGDLCTADVLVGGMFTCNATCTSAPITSCADGDGCCPSGCDNNTDADCAVACGNGVVEAGETCDPPGACVLACDDADACTTDTLVGSPASCDTACATAPVTACAHGDGCCPSGCDSLSDDDCAVVCGNGVQEVGETCDPPSSCPLGCDDADPCTVEAISGTPATCDVVCTTTPLLSCVGGDDCCPAGCFSLSDSDCPVLCGNEVIEAGETCDPPSSCPDGCNDADACTTDTLLGGSESCDAECSNLPVTECKNFDLCCAPGCSSLDDNDCPPVCGNDLLEAGEVCDPPGDCPTQCDDGDVCTADTLLGSPATCTATCSNVPITTCGTGDGCCPAGCNSLNDAECAPVCGNTVLESGELCDPPSTCLTACSDGDVCTADVMLGSPGTCDTTCTFPAITACSAGDGCCPAGCTEASDPDCAAICGNQTIESGETCDPPATCPTSCDDGDACTTDAMTGEAATCDVDCVPTPVTACAGGDGCCPSGCDNVTDGDCDPVCDNGVIEAGETCDPPGSCPVACDDGDICTTDTLLGSAATCTAACTYEQLGECVGGDGCCPLGCDETQDSDCDPICGNGVVETGEHCDLPSTCPTACDDFDPCTTDTLQGSFSTCDALCTTAPVTACDDAAEDGCCPPGCNETNDADCTPICPNGVVETGETCDPAGDCPTSCDDGDACTINMPTGSTTTCNVVCTFPPLTSCIDGDTCCPTGCDITTDDDCTCPPTCVHDDACCPVGCDIFTDNDCALDCTDPATWPVAWEVFEQEVLTLTNEMRGMPQVCGTDPYPPVGPLGFDAQLTEAARCHTLDQAIADFVGHTGSNGSTMTQRINATGYNWFTIGENVAGGQPTPLAVVQAWMNSPGHCTNIMNGNFTELGVGYVFWPESTYRHYWTQNFGTPQ